MKCDLEAQNEKSEIRDFYGLENGVVARFFGGIKKAPVFWGILSVQNGKSEILDFYKWYKWRCGVFFSLSIKKASDNDLRRLGEILHTGFLSEIRDFHRAFKSSSRFTAYVPTLATTTPAATLAR